MTIKLKTDISLRLLLVLMTFMMIVVLSACSEQKADMQPLIDNEKHQLDQLFTQHAEKSEVLNQAKKEQGTFRNMVWDSDQVNALEREIEQLDQAIGLSQERLSQLESVTKTDNNSSWSSSLIGGGIVALVLTVLLPLIGEGGAMGENAIGGFLLLFFIAALLFKFVFF